MNQMICPKCKYEYRKSFSTCPDCGVALVLKLQQEEIDKQQNGNLEIYREHRLWGLLRPYAIIVDEEKSGSVKDDNTTLIPLSPGTHSVMVKVGWNKTNTLKVNIETNKTTKLHVDYKRLKGRKLFALSAAYVALILAGATFGMGALIGIGVVGFMFNRVGKMYLHHEKST